MLHSSLYRFPEIVSFTFKKVDDGSTIKLAFESHIKMHDFIEDVIAKSHFAFQIPENKNIEIVEAGPKKEQGDPLNATDNSLIRDKYAYNYKTVAFYVRTI